MKRKVILLLGLFFGFFPVCGLALTEALPLRAPEPKNNPSTPAKVELGKKLFFEPRLSKSGTISCNSCHNLMSGGDDGRASSIGHLGAKGGRSAPTVWNAAFLSSQFWDGRAATLEEQAQGPMTNPVEMAMENHDLVIQRIKKIPGYVLEFQKVWGTSRSINIDTVAKSIAAFERTLITPNSRFDLFIKGKKSALSTQERKGWETVQRVGCLGCHSGPNFSNPVFQKFPLIPGTDFEKKYKLNEDQGRFTHTHKEEDRGFWRVPTWRNVALTAPYFHNGSVTSLPEAVRVMGKTQLNRDLSDSEVSDIVAFLDALSGPFPSLKMPRLPELRNFSLVVE